MGSSGVGPGSRSLVELELPVRVETYEPAQYVAWCAEEPAARNEILARSGALGRDADVAHNQYETGQNFPEYCFAARLTEEGWPARTIVYENYRLTTKLLSPLRADSPKYLQNAEPVRAAFTDTFLREYDQFVASNQSDVAAQLDLRVPDLFAWDPKGSGRVGIWEVKRWAEGRNATEPKLAHQTKTLGFVLHACWTAPERVLRNPNLRVEGGWVVFVPRDRRATLRIADVIADEDRVARFYV